MSVLARLLVCACLAVVAAGVTAALAPGLFGGSVSGLCRGLLEALRRADALDGQNRAMSRCLHAKHEVAREVAAGKVGLHEAARRFHELEAEARDECISQGGRERPSADHEAVCRNVMLWVGQLLQRDPRRAEVMDRLQREHQRGPGRAAQH